MLNASICTLSRLAKCPKNLCRHSCIKYAANPIAKPDYALQLPTAALYSVATRHQWVTSGFGYFIKRRNRLRRRPPAVDSYWSWLRPVPKSCLMPQIVSTPICPFSNWVPPLSLSPCVCLGMCVLGCPAGLRLNKYLSPQKYAMKFAWNEISDQATNCSPTLSGFCVT